jgi:hypothetical protein
VDSLERIRRFNAVKGLGYLLQIGRLVGGISLLVLATSSPISAAAETELGLERSVKAAFLYKFLNYATWPAGAFADASSPFVIGIYGSGPMTQELASLVADRPVSGRPIEVRSVKRDDPFTGLHVLFVDKSETGQLASLAQIAQQRGILLVSESDRALALGSAINLVVVDGRIRFDISLPAAEKSGVRLSSRLLAVARSVRGDPN